MRIPRSRGAADRSRDGPALGSESPCFVPLRRCLRLVPIRWRQVVVCGWLVHPPGCLPVVPEDITARIPSVRGCRRCTDMLHSITLRRASGFRMDCSKQERTVPTAIAAGPLAASSAEVTCRWKAGGHLAVATKVLPARSHQGLGCAAWACLRSSNRRAEGFSPRVSNAFTSAQARS